MEISEPLAQILGFKEVSQSLKYRPSYYDMYASAIEWLRTPTENLLDVGIADSPVTPHVVTELTRLHKWVCPTFGLAVNGQMIFFPRASKIYFILISPLGTPLYVILQGQQQGRGPEATCW